MAIDLTFDLTTGSGGPVSVMQNIIAMRSKELSETTQDSCTAIAINILKSLRADTKVAKVNEKPTIRVQCIDSMCLPSWKNVGKGKHVSIFRAGKNGGEVKPKLKVVHIEGKYHKGMVRHAYRITDEIAPNVSKKYIIVALSVKDAYDYAKRKHKERIRHHTGLAKLALGVAMHEVHNENLGQYNTEVLGFAEQNVDAKVSSTGFNSGVTNIHVHDKLDYAADALKSGPNGVNLAMMKALNKMTSYIIHRLHQKGMQTSLKIPYPDLAKGGKTT